MLLTLDAIDYGEMPLITENGRQIIRNGSTHSTGEKPDFVEWLL
jgi:hypothetical protein